MIENNAISILQRLYKHTIHIQFFLSLLFAIKIESLKNNFSLRFIQYVLLHKA